MYLIRKIAPILLVSIALISSLWGQRIEVYFSQGIDVELCDDLGISPLPDGWNVRLDSLLATLIDSAEYSVDMCVYNFDDEAIDFLSPAIRRAVDRGIKFRLVADYHYFDNEEVIDSLETWDISWINDIFGEHPSSDYMHCKFFVIDGRDSDTTNDIAIVSSSNLTVNNLLRDANNTVVVYWVGLSKELTTQFNIYWGSESDVPNPDSSFFSDDFPDSISHIIPGTDALFELYFSPQKPQYEDSILKKIAFSEHEVFFCANIFTRDNEYIDDTLKSLFYRGVDIRGVFGRRDNVYWDMLGENTGGDTVYNWNPTLSDLIFPDAISGIIHSKSIISDVLHPDSDPFVLTGSMNWSDPGFHNNNECVLIIHSYDIAQKYFAEFATRYIEAGGILDAITAPSPTAKPTVRIFPNPTCYKFDIYPRFPIQLFDLRGNIVGEFNPPVKLQNTPPGKYIVRWKKGSAAITII
ncbi:hypothetical protein DRQ33_08200, partial [bacterium]